MQRKKVISMINVLLFAGLAEKA
ncbi:hypothetical protein V7422_12095, partial [Bacillus safensis]